MVKRGGSAARASRRTKGDGNASFYGALGPEGLADLVAAAKTRADLAWLRPQLGGRLRVLDLACGYGRIAIPLARRTTLTVTGIDLDRGLIAAARKAAKSAGVNARFDIGDMTDLPYAEGSFDRVLCLWSSFQHLLTRSARRACLREIHRVLTPGGSALIEVVDAGDAATEARLRREGRGPGRRIAAWTIGGATIRSFLHNRETLERAIQDWPGNGSIDAVSIHGNRRLVARLHRDRLPDHD